MKAVIAAIITFFNSLFLGPAPIATPPGSPQPTAQVALPTPSYPRTTYVNAPLNFQLLYPTDTEIKASPDDTTIWDTQYTLRIDQYLSNSLDMEKILDTDLMCNADGVIDSVDCSNTAVKPFTNQSGTKGYLVRRTKTITGPTRAGEYKDTAYIFPVNSSAASAVIISVEYPLPQNLEVLADVANWFTALP